MPPLILDPQLQAYLDKAAEQDRLDELAWDELIRNLRNINQAIGCEQRNAQKALSHGTSH